jgi:hypothetical protein
MSRESWDENVSTAVVLTLGAVLVTVVATLVTMLWTAAGGGRPLASRAVSQHVAGLPHRPVPATVTEATATGGIGLLAPPGPARQAQAGSATGRSSIGARDPGRSTAAPVPACGADQTLIGYAGVLRTGQAAAARSALGAQLLAQVRNTATGQLLDLARGPVGFSRAALSSYFTRWRAVYPVASEPPLRSCSQLPTGPAGRQVLSAAAAAVVRAGYFRSAAALRSQLQTVLISDNPVATRSLIVTLLVPGPAENPTVPGYHGSHPALHRLVGDTVLVTWPAARVTGVAKGGL